MSELYDRMKKGETLTDDEKKQLTPEELEQHNKELLSSIEGRREELRKLDAKRDDAEKRTVTDFASATLKGYTQKAENQVFSQLASQGIELTEERKASIRKMRERIDDGHVTYDEIVDDFLSAAAAVNKDTLYSDRSKRIDFEKEASRFNSQGAGVNGSGPSNEDKGKFPQEVWDWVNESARKGITITPEQAQRFLTEGQRRVY